MFTLKAMNLVVQLLIVASWGVVSGQAFSFTAFLQSIIPGTYFQGNDFCVSANNGRPDDFRGADSTSAYVNIRNSCQRRTIFEFEDVGDGFLIKAVDIRTTLAPVANGWYLAVHDDLASDAAAPAGVRVILHSDPARAAVWGLVEADSPDGTAVAVLEVVRNLEPTTTDTVFSYLAIADAPVRSSQSFYLAVSPDASRALLVEVIPEEPDV